VLIPDSDAWSSQPTDFFGQDHFEVVKSIAQTSLNATGAGWFMTLLGTAHSSITDAGLIAGSSLLSLFDSGSANATLDPATAIDKYVNVSTEFFRYLKNGTVTGILALNVTDPTYTVRPPNSSTPGNESSYWEIHVAPVSRQVFQFHDKMQLTIFHSSSNTSTSTAPGASGTNKSGANPRVAANLLGLICLCIAAISLI
jgi:platelet-activating factor acetylhydrolase